MEEFKNLNECLVCGYDDLITHCDLGMQPLVNNLKDSPEQEERKFPILVNACRVCSHKQLSIAVDPKLMFSNYLYQTGASQSHRAFFLEFASSIDPGDAILDIGCNDGTMLEVFAQICEAQRIGVEPAQNLFIQARNKGSYIINDFFPTNELNGMEFDCITAFNVFAHNSDPHTFLKEMVKLLALNGRIYILTTRDDIGSFYHEHVSYFTPRSMMVLAEKCGLQMNSFKEVSMHGNSYLFELSKPDVVNHLLMGVALKINIKHSNNVVAYGASANGIVFLNHFDIRPEYVIDDNPLKQGKFIPGVNVPIYDNKHLAEDVRDLNIVILAYHLFDEIVNKIKVLRPNAKDKFIHPFEGVK